MPPFAAVTPPDLKFLDVPGPAARGGGARRLAWWDWSNPHARSSGRVVVCVHGLSRQGRDFDVLAGALAQGADGVARVVSVDVAGRGHSDWLDDPMAYQVPTYVADLLALLAHLRAEGATAIDWVGTSMGGLIGLGVAAQPVAVSGGLRRLVLNDVGPAIRWEALQRIASYLGQDPSFDSAEAAIAYLGGISQSFGPHTPEQWDALSRPLLRERDGRWHLHYDPAIAVPVKALVALPPEAAQQAVAAGEAALWAAYDSLSLPTLLLRGAESDLLTPETAEAMTRRGPRARLVQFAGVGHAPTLVAPDQVAAVRAFLLEQP